MQVLIDIESVESSNCGACLAISIVATLMDHSGWCAATHSVTQLGKVLKPELPLHTHHLLEERPRDTLTEQRIPLQASPPRSNRNHGGSQPFRDCCSGPGY